MNKGNDTIQLSELITNWNVTGLQNSKLHDWANKLTLTFVSTDRNSTCFNAWNKYSILSQEFTELVNREHEHCKHTKHLKGYSFQDVALLYKEDVIITTTDQQYEMDQLHLQVLKRWAYQSLYKIFYKGVYSRYGTNWKTLIL
jgi:hypothetical protein